jgi:hypothetical protein
MMIGYNGAFSIASKSDIDDQNLLFATVVKIHVFVPQIYSIYDTISLTIK